MKQPSITMTALADTPHEVKPAEIAQAGEYVIAELFDYIRWLADQDSSFPVTIGQIWALYSDGVRVGRVWSEVCEDVGLPVRDEWL